jgi:hypothetical protein
LTLAVQPLTVSTFTRTHTADALIDQQGTRSHFADSLIRASLLGTHTTDTLVEGKTASLYATGDGTKTDVVNENDATTDLWQSIDDDPASPSDSDWVNNADVI